MEPDNPTKERRICGTCRWYDPLCDFCCNPNRPCKAGNREKWEPDK